MDDRMTAAANSMRVRPNPARNDLLAGVQSDARPGSLICLIDADGYKRMYRVEAFGMLETLWSEDDE